MNRRAALAAIQKAALTTGADSGASLLNPEQDAAFAVTIRDKSVFGSVIDQIRRRAESGELNKMSFGRRQIRGKVENNDDGYVAAAPNFPTVEYQAKKLWLPAEATEDEFHENIEEQALEAKLLNGFTTTFANDLDDLDINGDENAGAGPDQAFLQLDDGVIALCEANTSGDIHDVDGSSGFDKGTFFEGKYAMPDKYVNAANLRWFLSPNRWTSWIEQLTDRPSSAGDLAMGGSGAINPLGIPPVMGAAVDQGGTTMPGIPFWPDDVIILADPKNFVRVLTWGIRQGKVTGATDYQLLRLDKRGYAWFIKKDFVIREDDAVVYIHDLPAIAGVGS